MQRLRRPFLEWICNFGLPPSVSVAQRHCALFVHDGTARAIDEERARFHRAQLGFADQPARLRRERTVQRDKITFGEHLVQFSLRLRRFPRARCLPMCHEWYVGMPEAQLKPEEELKQAADHKNQRQQLN